jgi:hypothetical protein
MDTYRIVLPDTTAWEDWRVLKNSQNETAVFERLHVWPLTGEVLGATTIQVFRNQAFSEAAWNLSDHQVANEVIAAEEDKMLKEGVKAGQYSLENVRKDTVTVGEKKLYLVSYRARKGTMADSYFAQRPIVDAALYVYIPSNYKETHSFYEFSINVSHKPGRPVDVDLGRILPVISGFELKPK